MAYQAEKTNDNARLADNRAIHALIKGIGWFSIGLGLAEVLAPGRVKQLVGIPEKPGVEALIRSCGFREIVVGIAILARPEEAGWLRARVIGDVLDLAVIDSSLISEDANRKRAGIASAAVLGVTALDLYCFRQIKPSGHVNETKTIVINRSLDEVYSFWRRLEHYPQLMDHLESVRVSGDRHSHWTAKGPAGKTVKWHSEIITDRPSSLIEWRSVEGSDIDIAGSTRFDRATGGRGTLVTVNLQYRLPGGRISSGMARLFGMEPGQQMESAMRRMKQILETGSIVRSEAHRPWGLREGRSQGVQEEFHSGSPDVAAQALR